MLSNSVWKEFKSIVTFSFLFFFCFFFFWPLNWLRILLLVSPPKTFSRVLNQAVCATSLFAQKSSNCWLRFIIFACSESDTYLSRLNGCVELPPYLLEPRKMLMRALCSLLVTWKLAVNRTNQRVSSSTLRSLCKEDHTQFLSLQNSSLYNYSFDHATHEKKSNWGYESCPCFTWN